VRVGETNELPLFPGNPIELACQDTTDCLIITISGNRVKT